MPDDQHARASDAEILRLRESVHRLVGEFQTMAVRNAEMHGDVRLVNERITGVQVTVTTVQRTVDPIQGLVTSSALLDRRVTLLERAMYGFIAVVLIAVVTAWLKGIIIQPHTAG